MNQITPIDARGADDSDPETLLVAIMRFSITAGAQDPVNWHVLKKDQWVAVDEESLDLALQSAADGILGNKIAALMRQAESW